MTKRKKCLIKFIVYMIAGFVLIIAGIVVFGSDSYDSAYIIVSNIWGGVLFWFSFFSLFRRMGYCKSCGNCRKFEERSDGYTGRTIHTTDIYQHSAYTSSRGEQRYTVKCTACGAVKKQYRF